MNNKKYILHEIEAWQEETIITPEQAARLKERYRTEQKTNPFVIVFSAVGAVMAAAGLVLILATGWDNIPDGVRRTLAFVPLLAAQILAVYTLVGQKTSLPWREGFSLFYTAAIFGTVKLVEYSFNLPSYYPRFILLCGVMTVPVFLIFRSVTATAAYLFAVVNWGAIYTDADDYGGMAYLCFAVTALLTAFGVIIMRRNAKDGPVMLRTISDWLTAAAIFAGAILLIRITEAYVPPLLLLMFNVLLLAGKRSSDWTSPIVSAGTAGTFVMMFLTAVGAFSFDVDDKNTATFLIAAVLIVAILALLWINARRDLRRTIITAADLLICVLFLAGLAKATEEKPSDLFFLPMACVVFVCGIVYLADGIREEKLTDVNIGFITVLAVLGSWFSQSEIDTFIKGIGFFLIGCAFLTLNLLLQRRYRRRKTEKEAPDAIQ